MNLRPLDRPGVTALAAQRDGATVAVGVLDPAGSVTEPDAASLRIVERAEGFDPAADGDPLVAALLDAARAGRVARVVAGWDPMDASGLRMLERHGFRPTGTLPYFELGGGQVEYVTGYRDATGSILDLARVLE